MIDAHCHLNDERLLPQVDAILARMREAEITAALVVGSDLPSSRMAVELARAHSDQLRAAVGIHPHESRFLDDAALAELRELAASPEVVAIGEIGLDFYYDHSPRDMQQDAFRRQLALAAVCDLPIIIHEREAAAEVMTILDAEDGWARGGTWHCCSVTPDLAVEISTRLYVGIAGWITFPKAENIRALAAVVPIERLLVETDAPYLTPVPLRGKPNEPANVRFTVDALAQVKGIDPAQVAEHTAANTLRAFPRWHS